MTDVLDLRVAVVTGSSTGIGRATAVELARSGWAVVVHGLEATECAETNRLIAEVGGQSIAVEGDIREVGTAERLYNAAMSTFGRVDGVVNNAGTGMTKNFQEIGDSDWESILQMHLVGPSRMLRLSSQELRARGGAVVNVSSVAALRALGGRVGYGAAKAAQDGLTRQLAAEWGPLGIRVNAVAPGTIVTPLVERNFANGLLDREQVIQRTPLSRLGEPHEVGAVVRFLLSEDASYITGQTIAVDGGWTIWGGWK